MIGRTYLEHGRPVLVLIRRASGELVVRPFRGLRRPPDDHQAEAPPPWQQLTLDDEEEPLC